MISARWWGALAAVLAIGMLGAAPGWTNAAPFPPSGRQEVADPQNWLSMRREIVQVVIEGRRAKVTAHFYFDGAKRVKYDDVALRMGFPELAGDSPLEGFTVRQAVYKVGEVPLTMETAPVTTASSSPFGLLGAGIKASRWWTWETLLPGTQYGDVQYAAEVVVTYEQPLTVLANYGRGRFTYVLRSGAPWSGPIGKSTVIVTSSEVQSAAPKGFVHQGWQITWVWTNWEPTQDVSVVAWILPPAGK